MIREFFAALREIFVFKTKVARTPEQREKQQARKEHDENKKHIDGWIGGKPGADGGLRRDDQDRPGNRQQ
jgi:hypothetical protein